MTDSPSSDRYVMRISRMTVDKLGVRLYDRVSAVVAELVANAYDADAENVVVRVPLATLLARKNRKTGEVEGYGYTIEVVDDGHGNTEREANHHFLRVGKDRRADSTQGKRSRRKRRLVMGRKGIGKLAPFGICKRIEIVSVGGNKTKDGYPVSHFVMPYDKILADDDKPVAMDVGDKDGTYRSQRGTMVRLIDFLPKRVPNQEVFHRQMARRFGLHQKRFKVRVEDTRNSGENPPFEIGSLSIPLMECTRVDVSAEPVPLPDEERDLLVSGWMGLAKGAYKNEEMAGVRIYARGKIVASTRAFGQSAGFTGEFTVRSYLVGETPPNGSTKTKGKTLLPRIDRTFCGSPTTGERFESGAPNGSGGSPLHPGSLGERGLNSFFWKRLGWKLRPGTALPPTTSFPQPWSSESKSAALPPKTNSGTRSMWMG